LVELEGDGVGADGAVVVLLVPQATRRAQQSPTSDSRRPGVLATGAS
jgi:hypothetical protein